MAQVIRKMPQNTKAYRIGGWGCESNREIVFVSFVRACERSCVCPWDDVASVAGFRKLAACSGVPGRALPFAVMLINAIRCKSLLIDARSFPVASRCFPLLPAAFPLLPAVFKQKNANLCVWAPVPFVPPVCLLAS